MVLQNWVTILGSTNTPVIQEDSDWLDMTDYQDLTAWIDVRSATGAPSIVLETAPSADEVLFVSMSAAPIALPPATNPLIVSLALGLAAVPIAQLLRWRIIPPGAGGSWDLTFRILVAANAPGLISPDDYASKAWQPTVNLDPVPYDPTYYSDTGRQRGLGTLRFR
jgi:hypothetical protein